MFEGVYLTNICECLVYRVPGTVLPYTFWLRWCPWLTQCSGRVTGRASQSDGVSGWASPLGRLLAGFGCWARFLGFQLCSWVVLGVAIWALWSGEAAGYLPPLGGVLPSSLCGWSWSLCSAIRQGHRLGSTAGKGCKLGSTVGSTTVWAWRLPRVSVQAPWLCGHREYAKELCSPTGR